jgi:DNA-binding LytR/AlgR family response regulator
VKRSRPIAIPTRSGIALLDPKQISHTVLDGELVTVASHQDDALTDLSLQELEERLGPPFMRVHRRGLVNLSQVVRLEPQDTGGNLARRPGPSGCWSLTRPHGS